MGTFVSRQLVQSRLKDVCMIEVNLYVQVLSIHLRTHHKGQQNIEDECTNNQLLQIIFADTIHFYCCDPACENCDDYAVSSPGSSTTAAHKLISVCLDSTTTSQSILAQLTPNSMTVI